MRVGLRAQLFGVTLGLLALLTLGALGAVYYYIGQQVHQQAERKLRAGAHVLTSILDRTKEQLLSRGEILTELPSLHEGLTDTRDQLEPLLQEIKAVRTANLLWVTDPAGVVLASTEAYPPLGETVTSHPLVAMALNGEKGLGFDFFMDDWWLLLCLPVTSADSPTSIGTVTLGLLVGEAYLTRLAELVGTDISFLWEERRFWSGGWPERARHQIVSKALAVADGTPQEFALTDGRYLWMTRPVVMGIYPRVTRSVAVLGTRLDETVLHQAARAIGWIALAIMVGGAMVLTGAIRSIIHPLKQLVADTQRVGTGQLSHRSQVRGASEVGELAVAFNRMTEDLQRSRNALVSVNKRLEGLLAVKDEFISKVSHELRTPLTSIKEGVSLMQENVLGETTKDQQEFLHIMHREASRLTELVNNMLDLSQTEAGRMRLRYQRADLSRLLEPLVTEYQPIIGQRTLTLKADESAPVFVDPDRIHQVFKNLLSNAIKFTSETGAMTIQVRRRGEAVTAAMADNGRGIAPEDIPKLFQKFSQVGERDPNQPRGTGLGLVVCKELVELHRGQIEVISEMGRGTTFTVTLPAYTHDFALSEGFRELHEAAAYEHGQMVGLVAIDVSHASRSVARGSPEPLQRLADEVRAHVNRDDVVLALDPPWVALLVVADEHGIRTVVRRLRELLESGAALRFGAALAPADGSDAQALLQSAQGTLDQGLASNQEASEQG